MKPTFPEDHPFHSHARAVPPGCLRDGDGRLWRPEDLRVAAERAVAHLTRQCLPAFDGTDPRD